jgi:hypothetical protein
VHGASLFDTSDVQLSSVKIKAYDGTTYRHLAGYLATTATFGDGATATEIDGSSITLNETGAHIFVKTSGTERARIWHSGGLSIANTVDPGAGAILLANGGVVANAGIWGLNSTGTTPLSLLSINSSNTTIVGNTSGQTFINAADGAFGLTAWIGGIPYLTLTSSGLVVGKYSSDGFAPNDTIVRAPHIGSGANDVAAVKLTLGGQKGSGTGAGSEVWVNVSVPNGASGAALHTTVVTAAKFADPATDGDVGVLVLHNNGGTKTVKRVRAGATDSGGAGNRMLVIAN